MGIKKLAILLFGVFFCFTGIAQEIAWQKHFGGSEDDNANCVRQTDDGGYIVAGWSNSDDQDLSGNYGLVARSDYWLLKLDKKGNKEWTKRYGGTRTDKATSIRQTNDGGFIVAGISGSSDNDVSSHYGSGIVRDFWVLKLDGKGDIVWKNNYGGLGNDYAFAVRQTSDGNYVVTGHSSSDSRDVSENYGGRDFWVVKLKAGNGNVMWEENYGGSNTEEPTAIQQTSDGGFIIAGHSMSNDKDVSGNHGNWDYWIVKLDANRNIAWETHLGGSRPDLATDVLETSGGNYVIGGITQSKDKDVSESFLGEDYWVTKLNGNDGSLIWDQTFGTDAIEQCTAITPTNDNGYALVGGESQFWSVIIDKSGQKRWDSRYGGSKYENPSSIQQTNDGGYIMAGNAESSSGDVGGNYGKSDIWVVKAKPKGGATSRGQKFRNKEALKCFPKPAKNQFIIQLSTNNDPQSYQLQTLTGRTLQSGKLQGKGQQTVDVSDLSAGVYLLQVKTKEAVRTKKVVVE